MTLPEFRNEAYLDFTLPANRDAMLAAQEKVRAELGRDYPLLLAGERIFTESKHKSVNPSRPSELVGTVQKGCAGMAGDAIERAVSYFPIWSQTKAVDRVAMLVKLAGLIRERKLEFNAWLGFESGKTWPEAEGET